MPSLKGHMLIASSATVVAVYFHVIPVELLSPALFTGIGVGTILPDLDHQSSTVNQKILLINKKWFQILVYACMSVSLIYFMGTEIKTLLAAVLIFLTGFMPHRAFTHKPIGIFLILLTIYLFLGVSPLSIGIALGVLIHILADKINDWLF